ncbi:armadillo-type protein [Lipomyces japonicus]|uniref:armadillo-type protein n=1 Tax=Lipomyces japonicus TaxID=56871 RepID=UPI0034CD6830
MQEPAALGRITDALLAVHDPRISNDSRRQAQEFLDTTKAETDAPYWGYCLANVDQLRPDQVRHFGLSLLEHSIKQNYSSSYDNPRKLAIRTWICELASKIRTSDPHFIKEKLAGLWVEVAKRAWGPGPDEWVDMDENLVRLWNLNPATRQLSLAIFRTLFEDVFMLDDPIAGKRANILSAQCIEILTEESVLINAYDSRSKDVTVLRCGSEGWLVRWSRLLGECLNRGVQDAETESFAVRALQCLKTCLLWVLPSAIRGADLLARISEALNVPNIKVKTLATDCLHVLFTRSFPNDADFNSVIGVVFLSPGIATLAGVYQSIQLDLDEFDESSYVLLKKLAEMIVGLGDYLTLAPDSKSRLPAEIDFEGYLQLVLATTRHESLIVSGLSLQFWCTVLRTEHLANRPEVSALLPGLFELAADRIIRYETVEQRTTTKRFLEIDFDSVPETHLFLGNYRRFIDDIARLIVCRIPIDTLMWLDGRLDKFFSSWHGWHSRIPSAQVQKDPFFVVAYAQFSIVDSALRGISRWKQWYQEPNKEEMVQNLNPIIERFCERMISMDVTDPVLLRKQVQTLVQFAPLMKHVQGTMFKVLEKVINACMFEYPEDATDEDREIIRDLRNNCDTELNRLAYLMPESLMNIYDQLEEIIQQIISTGRLSDHEVVSFYSFLLVVSQRSNSPNKAECFAKIVDPILRSWEDEVTVKGLLDLEWFMGRVGIGEIADYFRSRSVNAETDLLSAQMDDAGRALKENLKNRWSALFPIRATRIFIQYTIEKLDHSSQDYLDLLALWKPRVQPILPHILHLISQIQAYHNPHNWTALPPEVQSFVKASCAERFWHVGISLQSRDEFVEENVKAAQTLRDFADSLGHMLRYTREYAFLTIGSITQLEQTMYEIPEVGVTLWRAVAGEAKGISLHAWKHLVALVVRPAVRNCPIEFRERFIPEFLNVALPYLDMMLLENWDSLTRRGLTGKTEENEELSEEMMEEYLLRQLTTVVDRFLIDLIGPVGVSADKKLQPKSRTDMRTIVLTNPELLRHFLTICTHIFTVKDTRCSYSCALMIRQILQYVLNQNDEIDDFLCDVIIPSCFRLLADPYFSDVAGEASYILTIIYTVLRGKYDRPFRTILRILPSVSTSDIVLLERELAAVKTLRQQRGVMLEFLTVFNAVCEGPEGEVARRIARVRRDKERQEKWTISKKKAEQEAAVDNVLDSGDLVDLFNQ